MMGIVLIDAKKKKKERKIEQKILVSILKDTKTDMVAVLETAPYGPWVTILTRGAVKERKGRALRHDDNDDERRWVKEKTRKNGPDQERKKERY